MALLGSVLVPSCPHLGCILAACWPILSHLDPSCPILAPSWPILAPSWSHLGPPWLHLGPSWPHLGPILAPSCPILAYLGPVFVVPRPFPSAAFVLSISVQLPVQLQLVGEGSAAPPHPPAFDQASVQGVRARGVVSSVPRVSLLPLLKSSTT